MTAPVWMASPPEVHSALLSSGPGSGPLLAAAAAWASLSTEYVAAADELNELVAAVRAGTWEGSGADAYLAAHEPYVAWLLQAGADSAATAAQHEIAAAAHTAALATMPTLAELAANHATHAVLVATNFFGINTIPIALNEADYVRMWIQAATTMTTYQAVSTAAVASTPQPVPAPQILKSAAQSPVTTNPLRGLLDALEPILKSLGITDGPLAHDPTVSNALTTFVAQILHNFGIDWNPAGGTLNGHVYDYYADASQPIWYLARTLELFENSLQLSQNPTQALQYVAALALFDWPTHIAQLTTTVSQSPQLLAAAAMAGALPASAGSAPGLAGLAGLAGLPQPGGMPAPAPEPVALDGWPPAGTGPTFGAASAAAGSAPVAAPASTVSSVAAPAPPPSAMPASGAGFVPPYVVAPPGIGFGSGLGSSASSSAKRKTPEPDSAAAASRASTRRQARARRRQRKRLPGYGEQFMPMHVDAEPDWGATEDEPAGATHSDCGAGSLGLAGMHAPAGLVTQADDCFDTGTAVPMLPASWDRNY